MQTNDQMNAALFLRTETAQAHHAIEGAMPVMQSNFTQEKYMKLLKRLYGFYSTVEPSLHSHFSDSNLQFAERKKLESLKSDLQALGLTEEDLQSLPKIEADWLPRDLESALGLMYVLEGSTLGGQVISRHLKAQLNLEESTGLRFFSGYGPQTGFMWKSFQGVLNLNLSQPAQMKKAARAAQITFEKLGSWLKA